MIETNEFSRREVMQGALSFGVLAVIDQVIKIAEPIATTQEITISVSFDDEKVAKAISFGKSYYREGRLVVDVEVDRNLLMNAVILESEEVSKTWNIDEFEEEFGIDLRNEWGE